MPRIGYRERVISVSLIGKVASTLASQGPGEKVSLTGILVWGSGSQGLSVGSSTASLVHGQDGGQVAGEPQLPTS